VLQTLGNGIIHDVHKVICVCQRKAHWGLDAEGIAVQASLCVRVYVCVLRVCVSYVADLCGRPVCVRAHVCLCICVCVQG
jgi:hypothetical protein